MVIILVVGIVARGSHMNCQGRPCISSEFYFILHIYSYSQIGIATLFCCIFTLLYRIPLGSSNKRIGRKDGRENEEEDKGDGGVWHHFGEASGASEEAG